MFIITILGSKLPTRHSTAKAQGTTLFTRTVSGHRDFQRAAQRGFQSSFQRPRSREEAEQMLKRVSFSSWIGNWRNGTPNTSLV